MTGSAHRRHARGWVIAAVLSTAAWATGAGAQGAAGCEFSRFAQGRVFEFPPVDGSSGGNVGLTTSLRLNGFCAPHVRVQIQSAGGANPEMRNTVHNAVLPYRVESVELTRDAASSVVRLLLSFDRQNYIDTAVGLYEHQLVLTLTP